LAGPRAPSGTSWSATQPSRRPWRQRIVLASPPAAGSILGSSTALGCIEPPRRPDIAKPGPAARPGIAEASPRARSSINSDAGPHTAGAARPNRRRPVRPDLVGRRRDTAAVGWGAARMRAIGSSNRARANPLRRWRGLPEPIRSSRTDVSRVMRTTGRVGGLRTHLVREAGRRQSSTYTYIAAGAGSEPAGGLAFARRALLRSPIVAAGGQALGLRFRRRRVFPWIRESKRGTRAARRPRQFRKVLTSIQHGTAPPRPGLFAAAARVLFEPERMNASWTRVGCPRRILVSIAPVSESRGSVAQVSCRRASGLCGTSAPRSATWPARHREAGRSQNISPHAVVLSRAWWPVRIQSGVAVENT